MNMTAQELLTFLQSLNEQDVDLSSIQVAFKERGAVGTFGFSVYEVELDKELNELVLING